MSCNQSLDLSKHFPNSLIRFLKNIYVLKWLSIKTSSLKKIVEIWNIVLTLSGFVSQKKIMNFPGVRVLPYYPEKKIFFFSKNFFFKIFKFFQKILNLENFCKKWCFLPFLGHFLAFLVKNGPKRNTPNHGGIGVFRRCEFIGPKIFA